MDKSGEHVGKPGRVCVVIQCSAQRKKIFQVQEFEFCRVLEDAYTIIRDGGI